MATKSQSRVRALFSSKKSKQDNTPVNPGNPPQTHNPQAPTPHLAANAHNHSGSYEQMHNRSHGSSSTNPRCDLHRNRPNSKRLTAPKTPKARAGAPSQSEPIGKWQSIAERRQRPDARGWSAGHPKAPDEDCD